MRRALVRSVHLHPPRTFPSGIDRSSVNVMTAAAEPVHFTPSGNHFTRSPAPGNRQMRSTADMLRAARGPGRLRIALRRLRTWWTGLNTKMDDRWPREPEDNLPE